MLKRFHPVWALLAIILLLRLFSMALYPLADTTEARYAEIARLMMEKNDWVTPWFNSTTPFWGKPPLSFWSEAASFNLFGINEFAARFPSWLALIFSLFFLYRMVRSLFDADVARTSLLIYSSLALVHVASGAVMTDPFLALSITMAMSSLAQADQSRQGKQWGYAFFVALGIGLLSKGPLVLALVTGSLLPALWQKEIRTKLRALPWLGGSFLTLLISAPWYVVAELKTPGFLNYFLIGEHFQRFVNPGWTGDLYGNAHKVPHGMIWAYFLLAAFPWGVIWLFGIRRLASTYRNDFRLAYLAGWTLAPLLFFSLASNLLWTYSLPALASASVLFAWQWETREKRSTGKPVALLAYSSLIPCLIFIFTVWSLLNPDSIKSEKALIAYAQTHMPSQSDLAYLEKRPFSAQFYSRGGAKEIPLASLTTTGTDHDSQWLVILQDTYEHLDPEIKASLNPEFSNRRYILVSPASPDPFQPESAAAMLDTMNILSDRNHPQ